MDVTYNFVSDVVGEMKIGEVKEIEISIDRLPAFRKYLTRYSQRYGKKFTTRVKGETLHILRVKYFDLERQINESL